MFCLSLDLIRRERMRPWSSSDVLRIAAACTYNKEEAVFSAALRSPRFDAAAFEVNCMSSRYAFNVAPFDCNLT
jgi:hypothetical protein